MWPHFIGELSENAYDFAALLSLELPHFVVGFHHYSWFYEHCASAGAFTLHDAVDLPLESRYDGYDKPAVAQCGCDVFLH